MSDKTAEWHEEEAVRMAGRAENNIGRNVREVGQIYATLAMAHAQLAVSKRMKAQRELMA